MANKTKTLSVDIVRGKHKMIQLFEGENFFIWVRSVTQLAVPTRCPLPCRSPTNALGPK